MEASYHLLQQKNNNTVSKENIHNNEHSNGDNNVVSLVDNIKRKLIADTCNGIQENSKVLNLHSKPNDSEQCGIFGENIKSIYCSNSLDNIKKQVNRTIPTSPERILDAPEFRDDYYLNLIDWSSNNLLAVGLNKEVYLWHAINGSISELLSMDSDSSDYITSTAWSQIKGFYYLI
jgi:cell division cycle protein 20 (cofactor of APC complex)